MVGRYRCMDSPVHLAGGDDEGLSSACFLTDSELLEASQQP